ncbi:hypothetical protein LIER_28949 [Lithospermum erythrorhizon]|uniref:Uncharacterized protein n=1 Tax=Lithospermum erythrorhizon TaxID=34254 RepID=A0AAV3RIJ3_LITER
MTSLSYDNSPYQPAPTYGLDQTSYGDSNTSQHYYPPSVPNSLYGNNYPQQSYGASYGRGYGNSAPGPYQPNMFLPS